MQRCWTTATGAARDRRPSQRRARAAGVHPHRRREVPRQRRVGEERLGQSRSAAAARRGQVRDRGSRRLRVRRATSIARHELAGARAPPCCFRRCTACSIRRARRVDSRRPPARPAAAAGAQVHLGRRETRGRLRRIAGRRCRSKGGRAPQRRARFVHSRRDGARRRLRALRADASATARCTRARSRRRATWRGRSASSGTSSSTCRLSRRSAARRSSATAPSRRIARSTARHSLDLRAGAQHVFLSLALGLGRGRRRDRHRHRRQRARLLRLSRLPARVPRGVRAHGARWRRKRASKGGRCAVLAPLLRLSKAEIIRHGLALGLDYALDAQLLRPGTVGRAVRPLRQLPAARARVCRGRRGGSGPICEPVAQFVELLNQESP